MEAAVRGHEPQTESIRAADAVLRSVFGSVRPGIRYRLWDGTEGQIGSPDGSFTIVFRDRETFRRAFSHRSTKLLAEAFVDGKIDVEGSLFACLRIANQLENVHLGIAEKLAVWRALRGVAQ